MQTKLFDIFSWLEGRYQFNEQAEFSATQIALSLSTTALIYEGAARAMSSDRIARELAKISDARILASEAPSFRYQVLQLEPRSELLVDLIDGTRTLGHLLDEADFDRAEAARLFYTLWCTGLVETAEEARKASSIDLIAIDEGDVEALSTGEIDAIAALARMNERSDESSPNWDNLEALIDASTEEALDDVTEPPVPLISIDRIDRIDRFEVFADDSVVEPLEGATQEAFSMPEDELAHPSLDEVADTFESDPALPRTPALPRRAPRVTSEEREPDTDESTPPLSQEIRLQVRARLDAQVKRIAEERTSERPRSASSFARRFPTKPSATGTYRVRPPSRDLEKDRRLEADLTHRLQMMQHQTYYELLEVPDDARVEIIRTAYHGLARKHDPERAVGQSTSRVVHQKAEQIFLMVTRALSTLTSETARAEYDRKIGRTQVKQADLIAADGAFELGNSAAQRGDWRAAKELYERAVRLNREEGVYQAHFGWACYQADADEARALELLNRAADRSPRSEEVHVFAGIIHEKAGRKPEAISAYQRALACNPDCVKALEALRVLDPPSAKKSGLLSRLNLS
jgi:tetratricopeptide (TPR) repeat protein